MIVRLNIAGEKQLHGNGVEMTKTFKQSRICFVILFLFSLSNCTLSESDIYQKFNKIISALDNDDVDSILDEFSKNVLCTVADMKSQVASLSSYYTGMFVSGENFDYHGFDTYSGTTKKNDVLGRRIVTTKSEFYINTWWCRDDSSDWDNVGLTAIYIEECLGKETLNIPEENFYGVKIYQGDSLETNEENT